MEGICKHQAKFTFAMTRHAIVDLSQILNCPPTHPESDRLPSTDLKHICSVLISSGLQLREAEILEQELTDLRLMYEPFLFSLSKYLHIAIPPWVSESKQRDNWQTTPWDLGSGSQRGKLLENVWNDHF